MGEIRAKHDPTSHDPSANAKGGACPSLARAMFSVETVLVQTVIPVDHLMMPAHPHGAGRRQGSVRAVALVQAAARVSRPVACIDPASPRQIDALCLAIIFAIAPTAVVIAVIVIGFVMPTVTGAVIATVVVAIRAIVPIAVVVLLLAVAGNRRAHNCAQGNPHGKIAVVAAVAGKRGGGGGGCQRNGTNNKGCGNFPEHWMILSQASGLVAMVVAVIGDMVAIAPLIDRAPLMLAAIAALRFVRAVLVVVVAVMIGFVDLFVVPFRGVIVLLIAMTPRGIVVATIAVAIAIIRKCGPNDGQRRNPGDDGRGFAAVLGLGWGCGKAGHGQSRADDESDELAVHGHSFQDADGRFLASVRMTERCNPRMGSARPDRQ
ncbi:membrane hypothetical protein [Roseovarius sp. EC-HK134]|nr:membrane hypothetical protein [Roseovarius sp. EC-HK134]